MSGWFYLLGFFMAIVGLVVVGLIDHFVIGPKKHAYLQSVCDAFNAKYSESRGVSVKVTPSCGSFKVTVRQPGVALPGVELFAPSKRNAEIIEQYQEQANAGRFGPISSSSSEANVTPGTTSSSSDDPTTPLLRVA